jgi:hypothetical protein
VGLNLVGKVSLDGSGYEHGLKNIEHAVGHVTHTLKGLALEAFGIYGIEQAFQKTLEAAEKLVDTSRRLGVGIEALQEFGFAAKQNGADIDALTGFIEKLNATRINPKKFGSYAKLGIGTPGEGDVTELIMKLSANVRNRSSQEVIGPLREIGGKGAGQLLPMLKEDLDEVREAAHRLGVIMKSEDAVMLKFLADEMKILSQVIVAGLAPAIVFLEEKLLRFINQVKANGTFYEKMNEKPGLWADIKDFFKKGAKLDDQGRSALQRRIEEAGASSDTKLNELNAGTDKQIEELLKRQKDIEKINSVPDFGEVTDEPSGKSKHRRDSSSDSLLRVGNFLGATGMRFRTLAGSR